MASYKPGFDPPTRLDDSLQSKRQGTHIQPGMSRLEVREVEIVRLTGHTDSSRRRQAPPIRLPRPSTRGPSPRPKLISDTKARGFPEISSSSGKSTTTTMISSNAPALKGKASRNVLRRKPSSIAWQQPSTSRPRIERAGSSSPSKWQQIPAEERPSIESSLKSAEAYNEIFMRTTSRNNTTEASPQVIPELDRYRTSREQNVGQLQRFNIGTLRLTTQELSPHASSSVTPSVTPGFSSTQNRHSGYSGSGYSASPSTRFSESPGPGAYSRDTTPTSMSSQSPGIMAPSKTITTPRLPQGSPALSRPPLTRRRTGSTSVEPEEPIPESRTLFLVKESLNSSSNSTVKNNGMEKDRKEKRPSPLPPSPPPRKSSQKFKKERSEDGTPKTATKTPAKPVMTSLSDSSPSKNVPPVRPSRKGTPDLLSQQFSESMAVIQSNLVGIPFSQERRRSGTALPRGMSPQALCPQQESRNLSRGSSPSLVQPLRREGTPAPSSIGIVPNLRSPQEPHPSIRAPTVRTPSPSVVNSRPRFGFFGRRAKTTPEVSTLQNNGKASRKGPAAGTGHEGYGRYGAPRGRSTSAGGSSVSRDRSMSASQESITSTQTHDPFLRERMSPVVIAGGGEIVENRNMSSELMRIESNTNLPQGRLSMSMHSSKSSLSQDAAARTTLWPSLLPNDSKAATSLAVKPRVRRPSDSSDDAIGKPSLEFRRSIQRLNSSTGILNLPKPLNVTKAGMSPSLKSLESSIMSEESQPEPERGRKGQLTKPRKLEKRPRSPRKWNFFHRPQPHIETMAVAIGRPPVKAVPHYAMLDSSDEQQDPESMDLEDILLDADVVDLSNEELDALQFGTYTENLRRIEDLNTMMEKPVTEPIPERRPILFSSPEPMNSTPELPQPGKFVAKEFAHLQSPNLSADLNTTLPKADLHLTSEIAPLRPSRLAQVGRIPKVVSARPVATSPKSFSRPFARLSTLQSSPGPVVLDQESVGLGPSPPKPSTPKSIQDGLQHDLGPRGLCLGLGLDLRSNSPDLKLDSTLANHRDFLSFSPRKDSEATTNSSGGMSFTGTTAIIPDANAALVEDEIWDEYNDLIENDNVIMIPPSTSSSHCAPFQYESYESGRMERNKVQTTENLAPETMSLSSPRRSTTSSSVYSGDMTARMRDALAAAPTPTTPMSFTDFFSGYGDRNNSVPCDSERNPKRSSQGSSRKSGSSNSHAKTNSVLMTIAEQESNSSISQVNLRVGSMTVSKWLTFGHVLFSPAREELMQVEGSNKRHSILVIDGLGNGTLQLQLIDWTLMNCR
jgi:hypothetical protein